MNPLFDYFGYQYAISILEILQMDIDYDSQLDFQLKLHAFQGSLIQNKLETISSIKIESQDQILQVIQQIHQAMKNVQITLSQLKNQCYQLKISSLYQLFKNLCCVMISAVKIIADSCKSGLQRNLLQFKPSQNKILTYTYTQATKQFQQLSEKELQKQKMLKKQQKKSQFKTQLEFQQLYDNIIIHKQCVEKTSASSAVPKLNQICLSWMQIVDNSDQMLEQAFYRKNQKQAQDTVNKSDYITKVLKQQLSQNMRNYFVSSINVVLKKLYTQLYQKQYLKIKQQIYNQKPKTKQYCQQTEIQGLTKVKQIIKQKKLLQKLQKQIQKVNVEKEQLSDQYYKASRNNDLYVNRIKDLQRKLLKLMPLHIWENKQFYRPFLKFVDGNDKQENNQKESQIIEVQNNKQKSAQITTQIKYNLVYNEIEQKNVQKNKEDNQQGMIVKKNRKMKRIYPKSRLKTDYGIQKRRNEELSEVINIHKDIQVETANNDHDKNNQIRLISKKSSQKQKLLKLVDEKQYKQTMKKILDMMQKIKTNKEIPQNDEQSSHNQINKKIQGETQYKDLSQRQNSVTSFQRKQLQNRIMSKKIIESPEIANLFQNFAMKLMESNLLKCQQKMKNKQWITQQKQYFNNKLNDQQFQIKLENRRFHKQTKSLIKSEKSEKNTSQQKILMTNNFIQKFIRLKKKQSIVDKLQQHSRQHSKQSQNQNLNSDKNLSIFNNQQLISHNKMDIIKESNQVQNQQFSKYIQSQVQKKKQKIIKTQMRENHNNQQTYHKIKIIRKKGSKKEDKQNRFQKLNITQQRCVTRQNKFRQTANIPIQNKNQQKFNSLIQKISKVSNKKTNKTEIKKGTLINVSQMILQQWQQGLRKQDICHNIIQLFKRYKQSQNQLQIKTKITNYIQELIQRLKKQKKSPFLRNSFGFNNSNNF